MALIWAAGLEGEQALAPLWQRLTRLEALAGNASAPAAERFQASMDAGPARQAYENAVEQVTKAPTKEPRTHALVVGVGRYSDARIPGLTTSVFGAWEFTDWLLTRFDHPDRPLGSLELVFSPGDGQRGWSPSAEAAKRLGLAEGEITTEPATLQNITNAFERWLNRARTELENAAFFYFSGHGVWKGDMLLLPEDAQLPTNSQGVKNLISAQQTLDNMLNTQPRVQCFFLDACQEIVPALLQNSASAPGQPLWNPSNAAFVPNRAAWAYTASEAGQKTFGPANKAPYFTQELITCLERRAAAPKQQDSEPWTVTTGSLAEALEAAGLYRAEVEQQALKGKKLTFGGGARFQRTGDLCHIREPEVFVQLRCAPAETMAQALPFVERLVAGGPHQRATRTARGADEWYVPIPHGGCKAGVEFEAGTALDGAPVTFVAQPTVSRISLTVKPKGAGPAGGAP